MKRKEFIGKRFGRLVVASEVEPRKGSRYFMCVCDCGGSIIVRGGHLSAGSIRSCKCLYRQAVGDRSRTHGYTRTAIYAIWLTMKARCEKETHKSYKDYGGRGIKICQRWKTFPNFLSDMGERPEGLSIERIDNDGDYEPGNCKWATRLEQSNNSRKNVFISFNGKTLTYSGWERELNIPAGRIRQRLMRNGWSLERALSQE